MLEAALNAVAPEQRAAVYRQVDAACEQAHDGCFPSYGPWGNPRQPQLPPTPLTDEESRQASLTNAIYV